MSQTRLVAERLRECSELQDTITATPPGGADRDHGRSTRRQPGRGADLPGGPGDRRDRVTYPTDLAVGRSPNVVVTGAEGPDLLADRRTGAGDGRGQSGHAATAR